MKTFQGKWTRKKDKVNKNSIFELLYRDRGVLLSKLDTLMFKIYHARHDIIYGSLANAESRLSWMHHNLVNHNDVVTLKNVVVKTKGGLRNTAARFTKDVSKISKLLDEYDKLLRQV